MKRMNLYTVVEAMSDTEKKRRRQLLYEGLSVESGQIPEAAASLNESLHLLYDVPVAYLVPEPAFLPPESIRFFYVDENYITAMLNGVTSIARHTEADKIVDGAVLPAAVNGAKLNARRLRRRKVHKNHHGQLAAAAADGSGIRTGFLLRSSLVHRRKGITICGFNGQQQLTTLRLDTLAPDIMIGIFDGELTSLSISEPPCGLRFGCHDSNRKKQMLSLKQPGTQIENAYCDIKSNTSGRIDILDAVEQMGKLLKDRGEIQEALSSHIFAYEFLLAAQKAVFYKKQGD